MTENLAKANWKGVVLSCTVSLGCKAQTPHSSKVPQAPK